MKEENIYPIERKIKFYNLKDDEMPIGCWWGPYDIIKPNFPYFLDDEYFLLLKESKINFISAIPDNVYSHKEIIKKSLDLAYKYNVGYFVNDPEFKEGNVDVIKNNLSLYINHDACLGIHVVDEPYKEDFEKLKKAAEVYRNLQISNKPFYINLFPIYGRFGDDITRLSIYRDYVNDFVDMLKPDFLSFDYYSFKRREYEYGRIKLFFDNLSVVRKTALENKIPMWSFVQAGGNFEIEQKIDEKLDCTYPNENMLMWNVNANLLFGAKAIQYFTFLQPYSFLNTKDGVNYRTMGMIGADGKKNIWFDYVKNANEWIERIDEYLMKSTSIGVIAFGKTSETFIGENEKIDLEKTDIKNVVGNEILVGVFKNDDFNLYFILNNDYENDDEIIVELKSKKKYKLITKDLEVNGNDSDINLKVKKGHGAILII